METIIRKAKNEGKPSGLTVRDLPVGACFTIFPQKDASTVFMVLEAGGSHTEVWNFTGATKTTIVSRYDAWKVKQENNEWVFVY